MNQLEEKLEKCSFQEVCEVYLLSISTFNGMRYRWEAHDALAKKLGLNHLDKKLKEVTDNLDKYLGKEFRDKIRGGQLKVIARQLRNFLEKEFGAIQKQK